MTNIFINGVEYAPVPKRSEPITIKQSLHFIMHTESMKHMDWESANEAAEALGDGWRLPTMQELLAMMSSGHIRLQDKHYIWSNNEYSATEAYAFHFLIEHVETVHKSLNLRVIPVKTII